MSTVIDVTPYIDKRNIALWDELKSSDLSITIEKSNEPNYGCINEGTNIKILVPLSNPNPASFAHELLHIRFRKNGVFAGGCLKQTILEHPLLKDIISEGTLDSIANSMEHVKMLPHFLNMGYERSEFLADYNESKFDISECQLFCLLYESERLSIIERILGTYCAMRADCNPAHNYDECYSLLKSIDEYLYSIIEKFWGDWLQYDVEKKRDFLEPDYGPMISDFVHRLADYISEIEY